MIVKLVRIQHCCYGCLAGTRQDVFRFWTTAENV